MLLVSTTRIIPRRAMPSLLPGHYAAVKVRKELYVTPTYVAECFFRGNGDSQYELHRFFKNVLGSQFGRVSDSEPFSKWLDNIACELKSRKADSRMGNVRRDLLISDVSDISERVESLRRIASRDQNHD